MEIKLDLETKELDEYLSGIRTNVFYQETVELYEKIEVHASGRMPVKLIEERRPSESDEVLKYRKVIYESKTEPIFSRVWSSLMKIRRSSDWTLTYPDANEFPKIVEGETLESYLEFNYPFNKSITNWAFIELLRQYLLDANAVVFIKPDKFKVETNEYLKPIPVIFNSALVIDFVEDNYALLKNPEGCIFYHEGKPVAGSSYYFITTENIFRYDQVNNKGRYEIVLEYAHEIEMLPVVKLKGILIKRTENYALYKSRISGMVPELNEAAREYSDLQASMVTTAYAERWEYSQTSCTNCEGTGRKVNTKYTGPECGLEEFNTCPACNGRAYTVSGPYAKLMVTPNGSLDQQGAPPMPPAGYIQKDVEIIKLQDASVDKHLYCALAAVNFQFLDQNPLSVSGKKTEIDKDELNNTVHGVAEDVVSVMDFVSKATARYRYKHIYSIAEIDKYMLPQIPVPEKFDLVGSTGMIDELKLIKDSDVNPVIKNAYEIDYATKKFYNDPEVSERVTLVLTLDPLANYSEDSKMSMLSNKGITLETYIISSNILDFVRRAIEENEKFPSLDREKQLEVLKKYAKEVQEANDASKGIAESVIADEVTPGASIPDEEEPNEQDPERDDIADTDVKQNRVPEFLEN